MRAEGVGGGVGAGEGRSLGEGKGGGGDQDRHATGSMRDVCPRRKELTTPTPVHGCIS